MGERSPGVMLATGLGQGMTNMSVENGVAREVKGGEGPGEDQEGGGRFLNGGGRFRTFGGSTMVISGRCVNARGRTAGCRRSLETVRSADKAFRLFLPDGRVADRRSGCRREEHSSYQHAIANTTDSSRRPLRHSPSDPLAQPPSTPRLSFHPSYPTYPT